MKKHTIHITLFCLLISISARAELIYINAGNLLDVDSGKLLSIINQFNYCIVNCFFTSSKALFIFFNFSSYFLSPLCLSG